MSLLNSNMDDEKEVGELCEQMNDLFNEKSTAVVAHALIAMTCSLIVAQVPAAKRTQTVVFMNKTLRQMVNEASKLEAMRMQ